MASLLAILMALQSAILIYGGDDKAGAGFMIAAAIFYSRTTIYISGGDRK